MPTHMTSEGGLERSAGKGSLRVATPEGRAEKLRFPYLLSSVFHVVSHCGQMYKYFILSSS